MKPLFALFAVITVLLTACPAPTPPAGTTIASISLTCTPTSISVGATSACIATGKDSSGTNLATQPSFTFTSSDTGKATVSSTGVVTGVATGSSSITAVSDAITSNAVAISVTAPVPTLASISLSCTPTSIAVGAISTCTAVGKDSSGTNLSTQLSFTFASGDIGKATVSSAGVVTGLAAGSSNVTAISGGVTSNAVGITVTAAGGTFADPNAVTATTVSSSQIFLQWETPGTKAAPIIPTGHTVERRTNRPNDTTFQVIVTITGNTQRDYNDTLLTANLEYIYRVKATYTGGSSSGVIVAATTTSPIIR